MSATSGTSGTSGTTGSTGTSGTSGTSLYPFPSPLRGTVARDLSTAAATSGVKCPLHKSSNITMLSWGVRACGSIQLSARTGDRFFIAGEMWVGGGGWDRFRGSRSDSGVSWQFAFVLQPASN
jgi:hypothetical protein